MARIMRASEPGFADAYRTLIAERGARMDAAEAAAAHTIAAVRKNGVDAVLSLTEQFDGLKLTREDLVVSAAQRKRARAQCPPDLIKALEQAAERILAFHERERPKAESWTDAQGLTLGFRWTPVDRAGLYAPGGLAAYPSSVLMNALPAKAAGIGAVAMATPPGKLTENPAILAAADIAGVEEIWAIGGAQAIAALAYGAGDLKPCDVVVGPGNAYVAAAKKLVYGDVGIDGVAGPSEVFILADGSAPPPWIAADLMAQAEHDADAQSVLFTTDESYAHAVANEVERMIAAGEAGPSARASWDRHGAIVIVSTLDEAAPLSDLAAPEHVQIAAADAARLAALVRHAGAIFLGAHAPEALGDYVAGPSHVLPTGRRARFSSGVSTRTFMKRTTLIGAGAEALSQIGPHAARIADAEGLPAHARSIRVRLGL
ncbi:MAG: histidinol dehydrogenase [Hyphomonadaceae bacterium]|nr:histidinol dehydrogenase [Hyphomonadaceae bacterium]